MEILRTHQIASAVIDIIDESKEYTYLVSPYIDLWPLLGRTLERAAQQKKRLIFIVRFEDGKTMPMRSLHETYGFEVVFLDHLHAKLYCNERCALVSSMNLYDGSQKRNFELGVLIEDSWQVRALFREFIMAELLAVSPRLHLKGYFHDEDRAMAREMRTYESQLKQMGYCVTCGMKMELDRGDERSSPKIVRCKTCYCKDPSFGNSCAVQIVHCHVCGAEHRSSLNDPVHGQCQEFLFRYNRWVAFGRRGDNRSV